MTFAIKTAMVLAAGRGERLRPLTDHTPKPLLPLNSQSLLERLLIQLRQAGIERCVINISYLAEQFIDALGNGDALGLDIVWSHEIQRLGAGGGLVHAAHLLGEDPFLLVSSDIVCDYDFSRLTQQPAKQLLHAVLVPNPPYHPAGDYGLQASVLNVTDAVKYTFGAIAIVDPVLLTLSPKTVESMEAVFLPGIVAGRASGELFSGEHANVGTVEDYHLLKEKFK